MLCYAGVLTIGGGGHKHICHISKGVEELFPAGFGGRKFLCTSHHENVTAPQTPPPPPTHTPGNK